MSRWGLFPTLPDPFRTESKKQSATARSSIAAGGGTAAARARRREQDAAALSNSSEGSCASVSVAVRVRPMNAVEVSRRELRCVSCDQDGKTVSVEMKDANGPSTGTPRGMTKDFVFSRWAFCFPLLVGSVSFCSHLSAQLS